ncbi:lytic transglycosylase [Paludibacterium paludis]|uniref:Lytic transglycosylase n=1 Tax=Paludibacterium paludis TaxID=1225769 RepID=A0A918U7D9_9NEIS|nr:LysM peptidoglycan-binding domain-containing protein [Paludibacterium paludis]GGY04157.1 lytic transglycosylase [Paludibacterium paludis]
MIRTKPLALSLSLFFCAASPGFSAHAASGTETGVDEGMAAGLDMMLQNSSLLRNGDNVWQRIREGFQLPEVQPDIVRRQERLYAARPEVFKRSLDRGRKYLFHIINEVERRGMPTEIALLPIVESSFVPAATSRVGAAGLWQFMPMTGRQYGLEQTWWYDGRRDVLEATRAALDYLQTLYNQFGDWNLALAAYNWGEGNLSRSIARAQAAGQEITYENLRMPAETRNYAPKLIAVRNLLANPEKFGLRLDKLPNKPTFVAVSPGKHMDIAIAARLAGMSTGEFKELNPAFNLPVYAYKPGRQMLIPANRMETFEANLGKWNKPFLTWQVYTPAAGESIGEIAQKNGMSRSELMAVNRLSGDAAAGRPVLVAMRSPAADTPAIDTTDTALPERTLIAEASPRTEAPRDTTPDYARAVKVENPARVLVASAEPPHDPAFLKANLAAPASPATETPAPSATPGEHTVAAGDTLYNISRRYGMSVADLKTLNGLSEDVVRLGQTLKVREQPAPDVFKATPVKAETTAAATPATVTIKPSRTEYTVRRGDTVFSIAKRFGVNHTDLRRWNSGMKTARLQPGQRVIVQF